MTLTTRLLPWLFGLLAACGGHVPSTDSASSSDGTLRLRHQILFSHGDDVQVFEGYMLLAKDAFLVKAFAGPGVDLFTVVRHGARRKETLHISSLADRIDIQQVGGDIGRVYLSGCPADAERKPGGETDRTTQSVSCSFYGEPLIEVFDPAGRLISRRFPEAHGVGLAVAYDEFETHAGETLPSSITLTWGAADGTDPGTDAPQTRMVIRLVDVERPTSSAMDIIDAALGE